MNTKSSHIVISGKEISGLLQTAGKKKASFTFTAKGMSMSPFIYDGDSVMINPCSEKHRFRIGDVVACTVPETGRFVIHRIIRIHDGLYLVKGDNAFNPDGHLKKNNIHGYVAAVTTAGRNHSFFRRQARKAVSFFGRFHKSIALLSRYRILTPICRTLNKIL